MTGETIYRLQTIRAGICFQEANWVLPPCSDSMGKPFGPKEEAIEEAVALWYSMMTFGNIITEYRDKNQIMVL